MADYSSKEFVMEQGAAEAANAAGGQIPEVPVIGQEENPNIIYGWTLVILVFLFYFFNIGEALSSLFTSVKRKMKRPESTESKMTRENTIREARLKQQELFDKLSAEAKEKGLLKKRITSKEKRIKNSTAYKEKEKKKKKKTVYKFDDDAPSSGSGNYRPSTTSRYGRRSGG